MFFHFTFNDFKFRALKIDFFPSRYAEWNYERMTGLGI